MATLVFTALGTALGGPIGGALGALVGNQIDNALFPAGNRQGSRLKDLSVTTSSYGSAVPRYFGQMRSGGTIIWATDLVEHSSTTSSGKGKPSVTTYSYTSSFAVAVSSRPIVGIGRIWADGQLLRGAAGDLKVGGAIRIYTGRSDQTPDSLIASAQGTDLCPAFRGIAYVVFEDLQLADYGNRIPSLTFEIFADDGEVTLEALFDGVVDRIDASVPLDGILGYSSDGSLADTLSNFTPVLPMLCDANGTDLTLSRERLQTAPIAVNEAAVSSGTGDFGGKAGYSRKRSPVSTNPPRILRYYDLDLDYQPGLQRAPGKPLSGQPRTVELPVCLRSDDAFRLITMASRDDSWARDMLSWRCAELDPNIAPGSLVTLEGVAGLWRVSDWEWRDTGVEISLERVSPSVAASIASTSSGSANLAADLTVTPSVIQVFEMPWDGNGSADSTAIYAAVSSSNAGWKGAAIYVDQGDGDLVQIATSGRERSIIGKATSVLAGGSVTMIDRVNGVTIQLVATDMVLSDATPRQLAQGQNKALLGQEIIQFGKATALGNGYWRLEQLLRGRAGTESAVTSHALGESFALWNSTPIALDSTKISSSSLVEIAALGLADSVPATSSIACRGIGKRPLAPVHCVGAQQPDGSLVLSWTRRARGGWQWLDGVDTPLQEENEAYEVGYGSVDSPLGIWEVVDPTLTIDGTTLASLRAALAEGAFWVRQKGTYSVSDAALLKT